MVDAEISLDNKPSFTVIKLDVYLQVRRRKVLRFLSVRRPIGIFHARGHREYDCGDH